MSPADLADRLQKLDWTGTSLQHQLAVSAAVTTLKEIPQNAVDALAAHKLAMSSAYGKSNLRVPIDAVRTDGPGGVIVTDAPSIVGNVVALPPRKLNRWTILYQLDGREWSSSFGFTAPGDSWAWVVETVAHELSVREDQVSSVEGDENQYDGDDLVTVDGVPVYRLRHVCK